MAAAMAAHPKRIEIGAEERSVLERWANARVTERRLVDRARIVLLAGEGHPAREIAERVGCSLPDGQDLAGALRAPRIGGLA